MTDSLRGAVGRALPAQVAFAILSAIWNFAGVYLIAQGQRAIGPTASVAGAVMLMAIAVGFVVAVSRWPIGYLLLTIAAGLLGLGAVVNAFSADPALWPSEFWRYAGAVLNSAGFVASAFAVMAFFRWKSGRQQAGTLNSTARTSAISPTERRLGVVHGRTIRCAERRLANPQLSLNGIG